MNPSGFYRLWKLHRQRVTDPESRAALVEELSDLVHSMEPLFFQQNRRVDELSAMLADHPNPFREWRRQRRRTALVKVGRVLLAAPPPTRHYGYYLSRRAKVRTAVVYPMLRQMLADGWLEDGWEPDPVTRPPRRFYVVTPLGQERFEFVCGKADQ